MNRLDAELRRLYLSGPAAQPRPSDPIDAIARDGRTRALVLALARPGSWSELSRVWEGLQADLELPAPAIAVDGEAGYQLWFSLAESVTAETGATFVQALRTRYLADVRPERVKHWPSADAAMPRLPATQVAPEHWSAFVTADLAPLFADEPWLDHPPGVDAQADLLSRVAVASPEAFVRACARLQSREEVAPMSSGQATRSGADGDAADPRTFLLEVMQDPSVDLRLRIDAAKALLASPGKAG